MAYVALPSEDEIAVVDATTGDVLEHRFFPAPNRIALSVDGSRLFVALLEVTGIAVWDLNADTTSILTIGQDGERDTSTGSITFFLGLPR